MVAERISMQAKNLNPLVHNVPRWLDTLYKSCRICCKIIKICLTILLRYALTLYAPTPQIGQPHSNNSSALTELTNSLSMFDHFLKLTLKGLKG